MTAGPSIPRRRFAVAFSPRVLSRRSGTPHMLRQRGSGIVNATIKKELIYQHVWRDAGEVRTAVFGYIERYYNHVRKQRRLGKISPADYERQFDNRAPKAA